MKTYKQSFADNSESGTVVDISGILTQRAELEKQSDLLELFPCPEEVDFSMVSLEIRDDVNTVLDSIEGDSFFEKVANHTIQSLENGGAEEFFNNIVKIGIK